MSLTLLSSIAFKFNRNTVWLNTRTFRNTAKRIEGHEYSMAKSIKRHIFTAYVNVLKGMHTV